jgi:ABC-2 type transport system permease protein
MNKTLLIFRHEFFNTIRRPAFIIMTFVVPLLALLAIGVSQIISGVVGPSAAEAVSIGYIDEAGGFDGYTQQGNIKLAGYADRREIAAALTSGTIKEYFIVSPDYYSTGIINRYTLEKQLETPPQTTAAIKNFITSNMLAGKVSDAEAALIQSPLNLVTTRVTPEGEISPDQGGFGNLLVPGIFSLLLVLSITFSSTYLVQGLGDEKESRLIEVLLSSVSVRQLLTGKVMGLGAAGLVQVVVWVISAPLIIQLASSSIGGFFSSLQVSPSFLILCVVYFILGYLLFAVISTGIGAISPSAREGQQLATIFTLGAVAPLWISSLIMLFPNNPAFVALTIFPITAPVTLMMRLGATDVPAWQIMASVLVLAGSIIGGLLLTTRIVRTFLLMYGKRPGLREIIRNFRNG